MRKAKCPKQSVERTTPYYLLTYGDMMTLLLTFFVLLFSMSTLEVVKFQAQIGALKGALGISKLYSHTPMQKTLPAPAVKESSRVIARSRVKPTTLRPLAEYKRIDLAEPVQHEENDKVKLITAFGARGEVEILQKEDEVILVLPSFGVFDRGTYRVDPNSADVQRVTPIYADLAKQIAKLTNYDVFFVGHTDALSLRPRPGDSISNNMELGFRRGVEMYNFFFKDYLTDKTRITFASQGDNVPIIPDANVDSQRRRNRRVEIHLKKKS
jgi:chemotaxis protein MotB